MRKPARFLIAAAAALLPRLAAAQSAARPAVFEGQVAGARQRALPSLDALLADASDAAQPQRQLQALDQLAFRAAALAREDQLMLAAGVASAAESDRNSGPVRDRALETLGKVSPWLRDPEAVRTVVAALTEAVHRDGPGAADGHRLYALLGLSQAAGHLPWVDRRSDELVALTALDGLRLARVPQEKTLSMLTLASLLDARGSGVIYRSPALAQRVEDDLLRPLESPDAGGLYQDSLVSSDSRYFLIRCLVRLGGLRGPSGAGAAARVRRILRAMSERDPDARLREIARLQAVLGA